MSKQYIWKDESTVSGFEVYPAWQGPQIVVMLKFLPSATLSNYKIIRNDSTFSEDILHGTEVDSNSFTTDLISVVDKTVNGTSWYYYSVFVYDGSNWTLVGKAECFSYGINWARTDLWDKHIPAKPYKVADTLTEKRIITSTVLDSAPTEVTDDPQDVFFDQEDLGYQHQLKRLYTYLSMEIDKYADLVNAIPKMFRLSDAPIFMLNNISELMKMEFKYPFDPKYMRELIRFAIPKAKRKGCNSVIEYFVRMLLRNKSVYIEEYTDHVLYWNDIGSSVGLDGNPSDVVTNTNGSFWHGPFEDVSIFDCFNSGAYITDISLNRIYSPYSYGIFIFLDVNSNINAETLKACVWYIERVICWLNKWFIGIILPTEHESIDVGIKEKTHSMEYIGLCWNDDYTMGWNDPDSYVMGVQ